MIVFPNCKINLGLHVTEKRKDGFHTIETIFYPLAWCDAIEIIENTSNEFEFEFSQSGINISGNQKDNLIYKAWQLMKERKKIPPLKVHLHKNIPMGAGLGGGSSDAAHFINVANEKFNLFFSEDEKIKIASSLGSDCGFFINQKPVFATGKGEVFSDITVDLSSYYILVVYPNIHSNTKEAYDGLVPKKPEHNLISIIQDLPISKWKDHLINDFEPSIFKKYPVIKAVKNSLYEAGSLYSSLSGSGSSVFGIFDKVPECIFAEEYKTFLQKPVTKIL